MFGKILHLCFSSIHCLPTSFSFSHHDDDDGNHHHNYHQEKRIMKSFNSLYGAPDTSSSSCSDASEPDLSLVVMSSHHRFFVSAPGTSNSILHSTSSTLSKPTSTVLEGGVPVPKYSPDPYVDFRESMEEMVRARRNIHDPTTEISEPTATRLLEEWEYLHQLLICYLSLNSKRAHKFIIGAFIDLVLSSS